MSLMSYWPPEVLSQSDVRPPEYECKAAYKCNFINAFMEELATGHKDVEKHFQVWKLL